ncbi:mechanosensitive ion channel protein MscS [Malaciobacter molluscorum]|uniref:mechanosensitive ion channel family protein n=1 Tax=Malaciobacter molluscorum TaxID=1032072 RepID=UPI00100A744D|nr:mechanosensitive ion channel domain-containing protein [Malaciobacter molluscorum]RXJ94444.1 mechanosensitive ion channel protein MscS [Malaciobacter molluscorum]
MDVNVQNVSDLIGLYSLNIALAIVIFIVGKWLASKLTDITIKILTKTKRVDETLLGFFKNIIYYILMVIVALTALKQLGVDTTSFFAILGAAGLAIGLALKDSLGNFASGVMIIMFRPFKVGDFITAAGVSGTVEEISIFNTVLKTPDNQKLIVPNGSITQSTITNVNANPTRRIDLVIGIGYDDDIKKAKEILENTLKSNELILIDKGITVAVSELGDSSVNFVVRGWVNTPDYWTVKFDLTEKIKTTFDKEGISIPFPQRDVHVYKHKN